VRYADRPLAERLRLRDLSVRRLRGWFHERGYVEVDTPQRVACPGIDVHLDAIPAGPGRHLATSPELEMKKLLAAGCTRIFQVARAFRADERGERHSPEFTILEWYAAGEDYRDLMAATEDLVAAAAAALEGEGVRTRLGSWPRPFARLGVDEAFERFAGWRPARAFDEERFFEDFVEKVEPRLAGLGAVYLQDWPAAAGALARRSPADPAVCERVELLLDGIEVCNGFSELTDPVEQRERFERDNAERLRRGKEAYPIDGAFLDAMTSGIPPCAGNALGLDRLLMALTGSGRLADVTLLVDP
jgi:lysyl-tRNA synthetase class 2